MSSIALKLTSLAVRTLAKPIATQIKHQAKEHAQFRQVCIAIAQQLHRIDMRLRLSILRDDTAIQREELAAEAAAKKEKKEKEKEKEAAVAAASLKSSSNSSTISTPTSSDPSNSTTAKQILDQASQKLKDLEKTSSTSSDTLPKSSSSSTTSSSKHSSSSSKSSSSGSSTPSSSSKKRTTPHIRPLSDVKAIERGATFISEAFLFAVAGGLILFEAVRSRRKESNRRDIVAERLQTLEEVDEVWRRKVEILERRLDMAGLKRLPETLLIEGVEGVKGADEGSEEGGSTGSSWWWKRSSKTQEPIKSVHERTATTPLEKYIKHEKDVKKHHEEEVEAKARGLPTRHENSNDRKSSSEEPQSKGKELAVIVNKPTDEVLSSAATKS